MPTPDQFDTDIAPPAPRGDRTGLPVPRTQIEVPWSTIARILLTLALLWLIKTLWSVMLLFIISLFFTAALAPLVSYIERRGHKRITGVAVALLGTIAVILILLALMLQPLINQTNEFVNNFPQYTSDLTHRFQARFPDVYDWAQRESDRVQSGGVDVPVHGLVTFASTVVTAVSNTLLVFVMTAYLLADGSRIYEWSVRYLPDGPEAKIRQTIPEVSKVVSGYVVGQLATSAAFGVFTFAVLELLSVPQALFLALIAAVLDAVPLVGVAIATVPAVLLALTVSIPAAIIVLVAYIGYQQFENYVLAPRVYRGTLQISSFAVLIAVLVGAQLLGIVGALLALPVAAAIPVVEQIWIYDRRHPREHLSSPAAWPSRDSKPEGPA